jgi:hypothetical protein
MTDTDTQMDLAPPGEEEPKYGGFTRFEIELEVRFAILCPTSFRLKSSLPANTPIYLGI